MKIGIMQPYFLPYIGYFQLIRSVDKFVVCDDVQYIKQGWINRNKILVNDNKKLFVLSLKKGERSLNINKRYFSDKFDKERDNIIKMINMSYKKAPYFSTVMPVILDIFSYNSTVNIAEFNYNSLKLLCNYLNINKEFIKSSNIVKDNTLKCQDKVIDMVKKLNGDIYINCIGGKCLYSKEIFQDNKINLLFIKTDEFRYKQCKNNFIPNLSIIDVLMFNSINKISEYLDTYHLI